MRTILSSAIAGLAIASAANAALVAQYTFDSATTPLADVAPVGTANDGTASASDPAAARTTSVVKQGTGALQFSAITSGTTNAYVTLGTESDFDFADDFTLALWAQPTSATAGTNRTLIEKGTNFRFRFNGPTLQMLLVDTANSTKTASVSNAVTANEWKHYAVVVDRQGTEAHVQFYVNGVATGAESVIANYDPTFNANVLNNVAPRIGARTTTTAGADPYLGYMDDVRVYNTALSSTEIGALVPEPASLAVLSAGGLLLARRSRRRCD